MKKIILFILLLFPINIYAITASSYIIMDTDNHRVLEGSNIHNKSLIASTTKIMTAMVVINHNHLNDKIIVGKEVLKSYGSGIYIEQGEILSKEDLLYGLLLRSGNDAAITLAYNVGGSMEGFSLLMNNLAASLNMKDTNFINSSGLEENDKGNISTTYDMALLSSYAIKNKTYQKIVSTKSITVKTNYKTYIWHNKNKLLQSYKYCTGGKTGYTEKAKRTLVTNASKDNINLTVVTFNDGNDFNDHHDLYEKYFKKLKSYQILFKGKVDTKYPNTYIDNDYYMSLTDEESNRVELVINYYPQNASNIIGYLEVKLDNITYHKEPIYQKITKEKESFWDTLKRKFKLIW